MMILPIRYQVFLSSTYEDLRQERQQATQAILESGCFPSGMELFPASDDAQWQLIKRVIEECDYYIVIVAGRYGSLGPSGLSFTEMEYDYAVRKKVPVLGFVRENVGDIPFAGTETSEEGRSKLEKFRKKVMSRSCRKYSSPAELGMAVMKSLIAEARVRPQVGWVRADQARSKADIRREDELNESLEDAIKIIETLQRQIRDMSVLGDEVPRNKLSQDNDIIELNVSFTDQNKKLVSEIAQTTWNNLFRVVAPSLYGFIVRKVSSYTQKPAYSFQEDIEDHLKHQFIDRAQTRRLKVDAAQIDACLIQFKELGLMRFSEKSEENGEIFRGVTLTELGERKLTLLSTKTRPPITTD